MGHRFSRRWSSHSTNSTTDNQPHLDARLQSTSALQCGSTPTQNLALKFGCLHFRQFPIWAARFCNPLLNLQPLLIHRKGKIIAACPACTTRGVRVEWSLTRGRSLCPEARAIAFDAAQVEDVWEEILRSLYNLTPRLESQKPGLLFFEPPAKSSIRWLSTLAALQKQVREWNGKVGSTQASIATDRAIAELAAHVVKPGTLQTVRPHYQDEFLQRVPTQSLMRLGLSEYTSERLQWFGLRTVKELSQLSREQLLCQFYHAASPHDAELLWRFAQAGSEVADRTPIQTYQLSIVRRARVWFEQAATSPQEWEPALWEIVQQATSELNGLSAGAVRLSVETKAASIHCNKLLRESTSSPRTLFHIARELLLLHLGSNQQTVQQQEVQAIEVTLARLAGDSSQSTLFDTRRYEKAEQSSGEGRNKSRSAKNSQMSGKTCPARLMTAVRNIESRFPRTMFRFQLRDAHATLPEDRDCLVPALSLR